MARSWDELSADHKLVFLLESFVQRQQDQQTPIACRLCDEIFFDNKSLINHFQTHFHPDGTFNPSSLTRNSVSQENGIKLFSTSSQSSHSFPVPVNAHNHIANENLGSSASKLSVGNSLLSTPSQNPVQFRGAGSTHRHHSYPSPPTSRSAINDESSAPRSTGPHTSPSPVGPKTPCIFASRIMEGSNSCFPMKPGTSTPQPVRKRPRTAMRNEVEGPLDGYTKPFITKLERPIEEIKGGRIDVDGNKNADELDLTLRL